VEPNQFNTGVTLNLLQGVDAGSLSPLSPKPASLSFDYSILINGNDDSGSMLPLFWDTTSAAGAWGKLTEFAVVDGRMDLSTIYFGTVLAVAP
jgi:hypothetical protein